MTDSTYISYVFRGTVADDGTGSRPRPWSGINNENDHAVYNHSQGYNLLTYGVPFEGISEWSTYADPAGTQPTDGTGGAPTVTLSYNTVTPIFGRADFKFIKDGVDRQGQGFSNTVTNIPAGWRGRTLSLYGEFLVASGTYAAGDLKVFIYDVTNNTVLATVDGSNSISGSSGFFGCTVSLPASCTSLRYCVHVSSTSTNAYTVQFQHLKLSVPTNYGLRAYESPFLVGEVRDYTGNTVPNSNWMFPDGSAISRTTYADLFALYVTSSGFTSETFTVTIASPAVFTDASHGFVGGERLRLSTTGALPTGLSTSVDYFVGYIDANTFNLYSDAAQTTIVNTSGTQSGTHSYLRSYYGLGDGSTTFNLPNLNGRALVAADSTNSVITTNSWLAKAATFLGGLFGQATHVQTLNELVSHVHFGATPISADNDRGTNPSSFNLDVGATNTSAAGGGAAFNVVQPSFAIRKIIRVLP